MVMHGVVSHNKTTNYVMSYPFFSHAVLSKMKLYDFLQESAERQGELVLTNTSYSTGASSLRELEL